VNINIVAKTRAKKTGVIKIDDKNYIVAVKEEPHDGKANDAIISALAKYFHITKSQVSIKIGKTGKNKMVIINK